MDLDQWEWSSLPEVLAAVDVPEVGDPGLEELEHHHGEDDEVDGQSVDLVADLAGRVDPGQVVLVHPVLHDEVEQPWASRNCYKVAFILHCCLKCLPSHFVVRSYNMF